LRKERRNGKSEQEFAYPLSLEPCLFIGKKAAAVIFGGKRVDVKNRRGVFKLLLSIVSNASDESMAAAWSEVHIGDGEEGGAPHKEEQNRNDRD
jgi:hypothetical protein